MLSTIFSCFGAELCSAAAHAAHVQILILLVFCRAVNGYSQPMYWLADPIDEFRTVLLRCSPDRTDTRQ